MVRHRRHRRPRIRATSTRAGTSPATTTLPTSSAAPPTAGVTWEDPVEYDPVLQFAQPVFGLVTVGPDGAVYVAGTRNDGSNDIFWVVRSSNAQFAAQTPTFDQITEIDMGGSLELGEAPNPAGLLGQVNIDADESGGPFHGRIYVLASVNPPGPDPDGRAPDLQRRQRRQLQQPRSRSMTIRPSPTPGSGSARCRSPQRPDRRRLERHPQQRSGQHLAAVLLVLDRRRPVLGAQRAPERVLQQPPRLAPAEQARGLLPPRFRQGRRAPGLGGHVQLRAGRLLPEDRRLRLQRQRRARSPGHRRRDQRRLQRQRHPRRVRDRRRHRDRRQRQRDPRRVRIGVPVGLRRSF